MDDIILKVPLFAFFIHFASLFRFYMYTSHCLEEHKNQKCRKVDHETRMASEERRLAFYAGRSWLP